MNLFYNLPGNGPLIVPLSSCMPRDALFGAVLIFGAWSPLVFGWKWMFLLGAVIEIPQFIPL